MARHYFQLAGLEHQMLRHMVLQEVGRLSNDVDEDSKKVDKKMNLRPFKLYCVYLNSLNLSNVGDFFCGVEFLRTLSRFKKRKRIMYVHVLHKTSH